MTGVAATGMSFLIYVSCRSDVIRVQQTRDQMTYWMIAVIDVSEGRDGEESDSGENTFSNIFVIAGVHWL